MRIVIAILMVVVLGAGTFKRPGAAELEGTAWRGVTLTTAGGQVLEGDGAQYQVDFRGKGEVRFKLDCNTAGGSYTASRPVDGAGTLGFGAMRMTRAKCPPGSLDTVIVGQLGAVSGYQLRDGKLTMTLTNGGRLVWDMAR